jgi:hypothetical protein
MTTTKIVTDQKEGSWTSVEVDPSPQEPVLRAEDDLDRRTYREWLLQYNDLLDCAWFRPGCPFPLRHLNWALTHFKNSYKPFAIQVRDDGSIRKHHRSAFSPSMKRLHGHRRTRTKETCVWVTNGWDWSPVLMMLLDIDVRDSSADPDGAASYISDVYFDSKTFIEPSSSGRGRHVYFFIEMKYIPTARRPAALQALRDFGVRIRSDPNLVRYKCKYDGQPIYGLPTNWTGTRNHLVIAKGDRGNLLRVPFLLNGLADMAAMQAMSDDPLPLEHFLSPQTPQAEPDSPTPTSPPPSTTVMKQSVDLAVLSSSPVEETEVKEAKGEDCFITVVENGGGVVVGVSGGSAGERMWACGMALSKRLGRAACREEIWQEYHRLNLNTGDDHDGGRARACGWTADKLQKEHRPQGKGMVKLDLDAAERLVVAHIDDEIRAAVRSENRSRWSTSEAALVLATIELSATTRNKDSKLQFTSGNNSFDSSAKSMGIEIDGNDGQRRMRWGAVKKALVRAGLVEELEGGNWSTGKSKRFGLGVNHPGREEYLVLKREFNVTDQAKDTRPTRGKAQRNKALITWGSDNDLDAI